MSNLLNLHYIILTLNHPTTGFPENRSGLWRRVPKSNQEGNGENSDDEWEDIGSWVDVNEDDSEIPAPDNANSNDSSGIKVQGRDGLWKKNENIIDKYERRPQAILNICLAQFATHYDVCSKPKSANFEDNASIELGTQTAWDNDQERLPAYIMINKKCYRLRSVPKILQLHTKKESLEKLYSELLLFFPWSNETEDLCVNKPDEIDALFKDNLDLINRNRKKIFPYSKEVTAMRVVLDLNADVRPNHIADTLNPISEHQNAEDEENFAPLDISELPEEADNLNREENIKAKGVQSNKHGLGSIKRIDVEDDETLCEKTRSFSFEQWIIFDKLMKFVKQSKMAQFKDGELPAPPLIIGHGKTSL